MQVATPFSEDSLRRSSSVTFGDYARISGGLPLRPFTRSPGCGNKTQTQGCPAEQQRWIFFFFLGFLENNAKYGSVGREQQQDLPRKDGCIHVSSEVKMQIILILGSLFFFFPKIGFETECWCILLLFIKSVDLTFESDGDFF